ncbi:Clp protease N-terminal domain-containing protein, partial [Kibdelosporangium lantanae]
MADSDPVEVEHLLLAAAFNDDEDCRSRLVMKQLGAHHFFTDDAYEQVAESFVDTPESVSEWTPEAVSALDRLAYWTTRTGDHTADSAHLLLACLEQDPATLAAAGVTPRDAVRAAITVRHRVSLTDRQP